MQTVSLGLIDTATTAVRLTTDLSIRAHEIILDPTAVNGWVAFGLSTIAADGTGQIFNWAQNEVIFKKLSSGGGQVGNALRVADYWVLCENTNDGLVVAYSIR